MINQDPREEQVMYHLRQDESTQMYYALQITTTPIHMQS